MPHFDGPDYDPARDHARLTAQLDAVQELMRDRAWRTLGQIAAKCGAPEASVSARLRDLRKKRFGAHTVNRTYAGNGLYMYQLIETKEPATP